MLEIAMKKNHCLQKIIITADVTEFNHPWDS